MNDFNETGYQVANDAQPEGRGASDSATGIGSGSAQKAKDAPDEASKVASDAKKVASDAVDTGRAYATGAVNAAGKRIGNVKSQFDQGCEHLVKAINDEPLKAVLITAVVSSLLTVWVTSSFRGNSRYC